MKLLKIQPPIEKSSDEKIEEAREHFDALLTLKTVGERQQCFDIIETTMGRSSLADWFMLYLSVIFEHIHQPAFKDRNCFLDAVSSVHLIKLHHAQIAQYHSINQRLQRIEKQRGTLFYKSSINLSQIDGENDALCRQSTQLKEQIKINETETLARFLLIVKIVSSLEAFNQISSTMMLINRDEIVRRPIAFIGSLAVILNELHGIEQGGLAPKAIFLKIDCAIECILKLLCFEGDHQSLIFLVRDELFEKKHLTFIDCSLRGAYQSVGKLGDVGSESFNYAKFS